jgi:Coenzyme PQQ synthesis protein D (PqqD)
MAVTAQPVVVMRDASKRRPVSGPDFALVETGQGGILLNVITGGVFALNESAFLIWQASLDGQAAEVIAASVAVRYRISPDVALRDVKSALSPPGELGRDRAPSDFRYERGPSGYLLSFRGSPAFQIEPSGAKLVAADFTRAHPDLARQLLEAAVPKLLSLRGYLVIHASAVEVEGKILAFSGASGAGKTTTASSLVEAGAQLICEDKLFISPDSEGEVRALVDGERGLQYWIDEVSDDLVAGHAISSAGLDALFEGGSKPLVQLGLLHAAHRRSGNIVARRPSPPNAANGVFQNSFLGSDDPYSWIEQLELSASIAGRIDVFDLEMPQGLPSLRTASIPVVRRGRLD